MCLKSAALVMAVGLAAAWLPAATVYVSPAGNDYFSGSSWAQPKRTIQAGVNAAGAYDVVLISNGVYTLTNQIHIAAISANCAGSAGRSRRSLTPAAAAAASRRTSMCACGA